MEKEQSSTAHFDFDFDFDFELVVGRVAEIERVVKPVGSAILEFRQWKSRADVVQRLQKVDEQGGPRVGRRSAGVATGDICIIRSEGDRPILPGCTPAMAALADLQCDAAGSADRPRAVVRELFPIRWHPDQS
jgi:hypothetical protein